MCFLDVDRNYLVYFQKPVTTMTKKQINALKKFV